jgi:hypothetical protein
MAELEFLDSFSPIIKDFIISEKTITVLVAGLGEGKTFGCIAAILHHAGICKDFYGVAPIKVAIIRDTLENIKHSIVPSIQEFYQIFAPDNPTKYYRFKDEYKQLTLLGDPRIEVDLFGIDDPASLEKLKGSSAYSIIWLNEPAPIISKANAGLSEEVYKVSVVRAVRRKGTPGRVLIDMNPGDQEHWTYPRLIEEEDFDPRFPLVQKQVWRVPYGDNVHLDEEARQAAKKMYANDKAGYTRYVEGEFAAVYGGPPVTPQYNKDGRHYCPDVLVPAPGLTSFAFYDSWHTPACVLGQITSTGRLTFIDTLRLENSDVRTLTETLVFPLLLSPKWKNKPSSWRLGGDCTMRIADQSNRNESAAKAVEDLWRKFLRVPGIFFEAGPSKWETIKRHVDYALQGSDYRGDSLIVVSHDNVLLHKALSGAWHYPVDNSGNVRKHNKPEKNIHSHPADAWANSVSKLLSSLDRRTDLKKYRQTAAKIKQRVQTYATGGLG